MVAFYWSGPGRELEEEEVEVEGVDWDDFMLGSGLECFKDLVSLVLELFLTWGDLEFLALLLTVPSVWLKWQPNSFPEISPSLPIPPTRISTRSLGILRMLSTRVFLPLSPAEA